MIFPKKRPKIPTSNQCCNRETLLDADTKKSIYDHDFPKKSQFGYPFTIHPIYKYDFATSLACTTHLLGIFDKDQKNELSF